MRLLDYLIFSLSCYTCTKSVVKVSAFSTPPSPFAPISPNHVYNFPKNVQIIHKVEGFNQHQLLGPSRSRSLSPSHPSSTQLQGIRGFRSWFESQFPNAMTTITHPHGRKRKPNVDTKKNNKNQNKNSNNDDDTFQSETFHHVLIDMNQLLHVTLRRSRTEGHALTLLIQELDKCMEIAQPTKSIVLAFDGPPAAAKLATQRRRRYGTVTRAERKKMRLELLEQRGILPSRAPNTDSGNSNGNGNGRKNSSSRRKKSRYRDAKDKASKEEETLKITPGTEFMDKAHEAALYWAWQRIDNPRGRLAKCRIYISPSTVPGEGEVKLLDWLIQAGSKDGPDHGYVHQKQRQKSKNKKSGDQNKKEPNTSGSGWETSRGNNGRKSKRSNRIVMPGESVAILGGDSDLVLEGLVIPPAITHNVFVILPSGGRTSYVVSLWETTLALGKYLGNNFDSSEIMRVRTDLVLLLIMNGNDYLPKLRGSAGFNKLFHTYLRLLKKWLKEENGKTKKDRRPYLIDPDRMEFNLPFCIAYFNMLASMAPKHLAQPSDMIPNHKSITPLSQLYSMVDAGFLPQPVEFERVEIAGHNDKEILRLVIGEEGRNSKRIEYDIKHRISARPLKKTKQILANMALEDLLGKDYMDLNDYYVGGNNGDNDLNVDDDDFDWVGPITDGAYSWEINLPAASSVEEYLKGLVWNLATYQDGVCSDYGYNYGRRMSPTAEEVASYFRSAQKKHKRVDRSSLLGNNFVMPLSAGLSCLAALPSQVDHLIPDPYQRLSSDNRVEIIFGKSMDPENNVFDMQLFEKLCMEAIAADSGTQAEAYLKKNRVGTKTNLRKIRTGDTFWTAIRRVRTPLVHPFQPPPPFSDRLSQLRYNPRIKASHILASDRPRWLRNNYMDLQTEGISSNEMKSAASIRDAKYSGMGDLLVNALGDKTRLEDVGYKMVYQSSKGAKMKKKDIEKTTYPAAQEIPVPVEETLEYESLRLQKLGIPIPKKSDLNQEKFNALQCLQILHDANLIKDLRWEFKAPSNTEYASRHLGLYEEAKVTFSLLHVEDLSISQDRNTKVFSRKLMKHSIAANAMTMIFQEKGEWTNMTVREMKSYLVPPDKINAIAEKISALQCLHLLRDARCLDVTWDFCSECDLYETVQLRVKGRDIDLVLEESRDAYQDSKASVKHRLAGKAMEQITANSERDWKSMTISELKDHLTI